MDNMLSQNSRDPIDREALDNLRGLRKQGAFLDKLLKIYLRDSQKHISTLTQAVEEGNVQHVREAAHSLHSTSAYVGAVHLCARCKELERLARQGTVEGAQEILSEVVVEYQAVRGALTHELEKSEGS